MDQDETWHEVGLGPGHIVLDGDPAPPSTKGTVSQFSAHVCCDQTAGWIKMPLGTEIGLSSGHFVRWEPSAHHPKSARTPPPIFGPRLLWPNGWIDQDATWYGGIGFGPGDIVLDGDPAPPKRGRIP